MGYGLGACIGAKVGCPDKIVCNIGGDGCFRMNMNELATASRYDIPIIQIIINNSVLGMVRQWQTLFYGGRYSNTCLERKTDFVKVAEGFGCKGYRAETLEELKAALAEAVKSDVPVWIQCVISREEKVLPMIPGGKTVDDMIVE